MMLFIQLPSMALDKPFGQRVTDAGVNFSREKPIRFESRFTIRSDDSICTLCLVLLV